MGKVSRPLPIQWKKLDLLGIFWGCSDVLGGALVLVLKPAAYAGAANRASL